MIDEMVDLFADWSYLALLASWRALPVFLVVAVLVIVLRKRVPARYLCWLWLIVIARLLLPFSYQSSVAISSIGDEPAISLVSSKEEPQSGVGDFDTLTYETDEGKSATVAVLPPGATPEEQAVADATVAKMIAEESLARARQTQHKSNTVDEGESWIETWAPLLELAAYLVVIGIPTTSVIFLLRHLVSHIRFGWLLRSCPEITDQAIIDCLLRTCDEAGAGKRPKLKEVPSPHAPAIFGLFFPTLCLPKDWREGLTTQQLEWVLRHEVAHVKGRDGLLLSISNLARSVQWFSPLSWIAVAKLQHNMERVADEFATRHLGNQSRREYGELLLQFAGTEPSTRFRPTTGLLAMAAPKGLQRRIESLATSVSQPRWLGNSMRLGVLGMVGVCGLTDARPIAPPVNAPRSVPNFAAALAQWEHEGNGVGVPLRPDESIEAKSVSKEPKRKVSIDVADVLAKARELEPAIDAEKFVLAHFVYDRNLEAAKIEAGVLTVELSNREEQWLRQNITTFLNSGLLKIVFESWFIDTDVRLLHQFNWSTSASNTRITRLEGSAIFEAWDLWGRATLSPLGFSKHVPDSDPYFTEQHVSLPFRVAKINRLQRERFLHQVQRDDRLEVMKAPEVTSPNGCYLSVSDMARVPFVTDVVQVTGKNGNALQPKISVFNEGSIILAQPTVSGDDEVHLELVFAKSVIEDVKLAHLPYRPSVESEEQITIQVPTVHTDSIAVDSHLRGSETLFIFSPTPYSDVSADDRVSNTYRTEQVVMIGTRLLPDNETLKRFVPNDDAP